MPVRHVRKTMGSNRIKKHAAAEEGSKKGLKGKEGTAAFKRWKCGNKKGGNVSNMVKDRGLKRHIICLRVFLSHYRSGKNRT